MMSKIVNSYLWIPDIMRVSGMLNDIANFGSEKKPIKTDKECKNKKTCKKSKIELVKGTGRYVYWNFEPKMIIDLDWIELNSKHPCNLILLEKRKNKSIK
jgi:hypothetical protein